jgi:hypothetical protein
MEAGKKFHSNFPVRLKKILWEARSTPTLVNLLIISQGGAEGPITMGRRWGGVGVGGGVKSPPPTFFYVWTRV